MVHAMAGLVRVGLFVLGVVLGAVVVYLVMHFTQESSDEEAVDWDTQNFNFTGSRANQSLKLVFVVSMFTFLH